MDGFEFKEHYTIEDLIHIVKILRSENGCPWDKEQTHESLRRDFIEEVYEAVEAIDCQDPDMLREELGDVLLQVVFHADLEADAGSFDFDDVADEICKKLIFRHPHVFGELKLSTADEVLENWDRIKKESKSQTYTDTLNAVPKVFPALMRAQKVGKRAGCAGMDFENAEAALASLESELAELKQAILSGSSKETAEELGDLLFSSVNVARKCGLDAEETLTLATEKFIRRFTAVEAELRQNGIDMKSLSIEELDSYWNRLKNK